MSLKAKIEAIIYAAEEPITLEQVSALVKDLVVAEQAQAAAEAQPSETAAEVLGAETPEQSATSEATAEAAVPVEQQEVPTEGVEAPVSEAAAEVTAPSAPAKKQKKEPSEDAKIRQHVRKVIEELIAEYDSADRGMEIRQVAGGYRMSTRPEHHDVVRAFAKSLKPPVRLSLAALETLAVIAYKQPVTVPEISEIRGVEAGGVIGTLLDRKLITTAGRKQVVGRPILYKTTKEFLMRFGLSDVNELPSMEEFEKLATEQSDLFDAKQDATSQQNSAPAEPSEATEPQPDGSGDTAASTEQTPAQETASEQTEPANS